MPLIDLPSAQVFYEHAGAGPPILLVHGWTCDASDWRWQVGPLSDRFHVLAPDLPGHGRSPRSRVGHHPAQMAEVLAELVITLGTQPCIVVGHSLGSVVAARLALSRPELVLALTSIEPAYGLNRFEASKAIQLIKLLKQNPDRQPVADFLATLDSPTTPLKLRTLHLKRLEQVDTEVALEVLLTLWEAPDQVGLEPATSQFLGNLRRPLLELYTDDVRTRWQWDAVRAATWRRECWPGLGHWPHQEAPRKFNLLITDWLASLKEQPEAEPGSE